MQFAAEQKLSACLDAHHAEEGTGIHIGSPAEAGFETAWDCQGRLLTQY